MVTITDASVEILSIYTRIKFVGKYNIHQWLYPIFLKTFDILDNIRMVENITIITVCQS